MIPNCKRAGPGPAVAPGTSVSAAYAAGVAATIAAGHRHASAAQVAQVLLANASQYKVKRAQNTPPLFVHAPRRGPGVASSEALRRYKAAAVLVASAVLSAAATVAVLGLLPPRARRGEQEPLML